MFGENEFGFERIDFFGRIEVQEKSQPKEDTQSPEITVDEWAEPIISPSGRRSIYVPPKEVRDFLEKPNLENARAYLTWNLKRIKKFILAQELLRKEAKELEVMKEPKNLFKPTSSSSSNSQDRVGASYLFYFMSKGCPACEKESRVIEDIYLNHPEIRIEAFAEGFSDRELENFRFPTRQDNGISSLFKVNSYPTIAVFNKKKQKYFLSGFVDKNRILGLFK
ncbi:MAG: conjugal transfer protein TraF [Candidatus Omnitrophica bacterium]|nr:conjugal transfer protein TraF [Candidatus Omnitrophota bacterium]